MGRDVAIVLTNDREIDPPSRAGMLYDETGIDWPKCSLLIAPFRGWTHEPESTKTFKSARYYFGRDTEIGAGTLTIPARALSSWTRVGDVREIFYLRAGTKAPGRFQHRFHKPRGLWRLIFLFNRRAANTPVVLYKSRGAYRLELPDGCMIDDRGIARP